jgi:C-methyltransferase C-terminal domain
MPGQRIPIRNPDELLAAQTDYVLLLVWNFAGEDMRQQGNVSPEQRQLHYSGSRTVYRATRCDPSTTRSSRRLPSDSRVAGLRVPRGDFFP